ncbi:glucose 1-dehydrogenase [Pigmentiphaga aceris]|uniref:Glucose 1-dehydrogenase n=1 Tax=Pigmentiphaga aceris TaxID=1940612 RepID=A0A5C0AYS6_9BURK|nr:3-oxoacyl-ACP reductase FabG [Pigmentiphaga aceris]QEI05567.1 glucose 1-dehydrogenase [Pigmentiphaga aceris]
MNSPATNSSSFSEPTSQQRVALVTGGAVGLGAAISKRLARDGFTVLVADIDDKAADATAAEIIAAQGQASSLHMDVGSAESIAEAFAEITERYGRCDVLVNNAGISNITAFLDVDLDRWNRTMQINVTGTLLCSQHAARLMRTRSWGRIINISSISGIRAGAGRTSYGTSKAAAIGLTKQMAIELAQYGITANSVAPGPVDTPMTRELHSDKTRESYVRGIPAKRYATPEEIAGAVAYFTTDDAAYVNGHVLPVDGGFVAAGLLEI